MTPPFVQLLDAHWQDVARLCHALAGPDEAEDAAQRTWLQALRAYPSLRHDRNLRGWLLTIAARTAVEGHRERSRRATPVAHLPDGPAASAEPTSYDGPLWDRVRALPRRQRTAIALRYVLDLPHSQIAGLLGVTPAMSRRLVSDGLAALRRVLAQKEAR